MDIFPGGFANEQWGSSRDNIVQNASVHITNKIFSTE